MKIVVVGCGKVGTEIVNRLCSEGHNLIVVDTSPERVQRITDRLDVMGLVSNAFSADLFGEIGMEDTDLFIAMTNSDEINLLSCLYAGQNSTCKTIARVRNPQYNREKAYIKQRMGISELINPAEMAAEEISRLIRFPAADQLGDFADGRIYLIKYCLPKTSELCGKAVREASLLREHEILVCAAERSGTVCVPDGNYIMEAGDLLTVLAVPSSAESFFRAQKLPVKPGHNTMIVGGGITAYYLAGELTRHGISARVLEKDKKRALELAEAGVASEVICADGSDRVQLLEEGLENASAFVSLTGLDEENILMSLFAKKHGQAKVVTKLSRLEYDDILEPLDLGSIVCPKAMTADYVLRYVRAMRRAAGSDIKTLFRVLDDRVEALEFGIREGSEGTGVPLSELKLKPGTLICCVTRGDKIRIPRGSDTLEPGDDVILVTFEKGVDSFAELLVR